MMTTSLRLISTLRLLLCFSAGVFAARGTSEAAALITVTGTGDVIAADGFCSLREAVEAANTNATVNECIHDGSGGPDRIAFDDGLSGSSIVLVAGELSVTDDVTVTGLGADSLAINGNHLSRVFGIGVGVVASLTRLTITGGTVSGSESGGGISSLGSLILEDSVLSYNSAGLYGGGIYSNGPETTVRNSRFTSNSAAEGGALFSWQDTTVDNSTFIGNAASVSGGGIRTCCTNQLLVRDSSFRENSAGGDGGAISVGGPATGLILNSTVAHNVAASNGGGISNDSLAEMTIANSTISGNSAGEGGGGIRNYSASLRIMSTTVAGNAAAQGGGIQNIDRIGPASLVAINTIVDGSPSGGDCYNDSLFTPAGPNLDSDGTCPGFSIPSGDARLEPLQDNGGPTWTHALAVDSDALEAGDNTLCAAPPVNGLDQRGAARSQGGPVCDIGAYEAIAGCELHLALERSKLRAGEELRVAVNLHHRRPITVTVPFLLWVEDAAGRVVVEKSSAPITMEPGDHRQLRMALTLPPSLPAGTYRVLVGVKRMQQGIAWASREFEIIE